MEKENCSIVENSLVLFQCYLHSANCTQNLHQLKEEQVMADKKETVQTSSKRLIIIYASVF